MINKLSHATIWVADQERALTFYRDKLGFEVKTDVTMGGFRWLTVAPKGQDLEIVLMAAAPSPMMDEETLGLLRKLMGKGAMGAGVFNTDDCQKTYQELSARGVEFTQPPQQRPYGVEAIFKDDSGNWFSLTQHTAAHR
jgi:predicted enzyme related to lactoylglutathione lyase